MSTPIALGGLALVAGAIVSTYAILRISTRPVIGQALSTDVAAALVIAAALLLLGLPALYAVQAMQSGAVGLLGHALLSTGLLLMVIVAAGPLLHPSAGLASGEHPVVFALGIAFAVGLLLSGIATYQADVLPRPAAVLLLGAMTGFAFVFFVAEFLPPSAGQIGSAIFGVLLMAAFAWLGIALWQRAVG
ncbi:MAG TPA: hypothetical protein VFN41_13430 [Candidatus Limnocylindrales bacterium]|nr:hypothetical protein [Candidatus Limnocylindrales bacterium]